jgi:hypothetical protein
MDRIAGKPPENYCLTVPAKVIARLPCLATHIAYFCRVNPVMLLSPRKVQAEAGETVTRRTP